MNIDRKDKMILTLLARNPQISQNEIADEVGLSQSSVAVRIEKLKNMQIIQTQIGINPLKMRLIIAKVDISTNAPSLLLDMFMNCPHFINGYVVSGKYNICLFFIGDNVRALEAMVNDHIRSSKSVKEVTFNLITDAKKNFIVPIQFVDVKYQVSQCGSEKICIGCRSFIAENCKARSANGVMQY